MQEIKDMKVERSAKLKFLAAALLFGGIIEHQTRKQSQRHAIVLWKSNVDCHKIAQSAFSKVLELNHRHSAARIRASCYLIEGFINSEDRRAAQCAFELFFNFAQVNTFKGRRASKYGHGISSSTNATPQISVHIPSSLRASLNNTPQLVNDPYQSVPPPNPYFQGGSMLSDLSHSSNPLSRFL